MQDFDFPGVLQTITLQIPPPGAPRPPVPDPPGEALPASGEINAAGEAGLLTPVGRAGIFQGYVVDATRVHELWKHPGLPAFPARHHAGPAKGYWPVP